MIYCACLEEVQKQYGVRKGKKGDTCRCCQKLVDPNSKIDVSASSTLMDSYGNEKTTVTKRAAVTSNLSTVRVPATLDDVVAAQNRTTRAVRAFVRFLFIQLSAITLGATLIQFGIQEAATVACIQYGRCGTSNFLSVAGVLTILAGIIWSSSAGWSELHKSEIPD